MLTLRALLFNVLFVGWTALLGILALPALLLPRIACCRMARLWARGVLAMMHVVVGLRVRLVGAEHLPRTGPALIAAKHQSAFDTIVWWAWLSDPAYVLKRELLHVPIYGWHARHAGMISVDRAAGASAMRGLLRDGLVALAEGRQVVIFPEGTRTAVGQPGAYQPGIAALYARAATPVVPVATDSGRFWGRRAFLKRPGTITVAVLPPIAPGLSRSAFLAELSTRIETASLALLPGGETAGPVDNPGESGS